MKLLSRISSSSIIRITSAILIAIINLTSAAIAILAISYSVLIRLNGTTLCQKALQNPLYVAGLILLVLSFLGLIGACCRINVLLSIYLLVTVFFVLGFVIITIFVLFVTNKDAGRAVAGMRSKEYKHWLPNRLNNAETWAVIKSCMVDAHICHHLDTDGIVDVFDKRNLSPLESGCCKPPTHCDFELKNATVWMAPKQGPAMGDGDCTIWSNVQDKLCYDCKSCKGGVVANIRQQWRFLALYNVANLVFLIIITALTSCAKARNNANRNRFKNNP